MTMITLLPRQRENSTTDAGAARRVFGRSRRGVTLAELLIVTTMVGLLTTFALPSLSRTRARMALDGAAQTLLHDFSLARTEAIRSNATVIVRRTGTTAYQVGNGPWRELSPGLHFDEESPLQSRFAPIGPVTLGAGTFRLTYGPHARDVRLDASGFAVVVR